MCLRAFCQILLIVCKLYRHSIANVGLNVRLPWEMQLTEFK